MDDMLIIPQARWKEKNISGKASVKISCFLLPVIFVFFAFSAARE